MTSFIVVVLIAFALDVLHRVLMLCNRAPLMRTRGYVAADLVVNGVILAWGCALYFRGAT